MGFRNKVSKDLRFDFCVNTLYSPSNSYKNVYLLVT